MMKHLSMRVRWRDQPWDERLCAHPLDNSSCVLLKNIGAKREDDYEVAHALEDMGELEEIPRLSERGIFMSPKATGRWRYEVLLTGYEGSWCRPDFTVSTASGVPVYWEHLGKMDQPSYVRRWKEKLQWYESNGIFPAVDTDGNPLADAKVGPNGILIWTDDRNGVDKPAWTAMAKTIIGTIPALGARRAAKKAAKRL